MSTQTDENGYPNSYRENSLRKELSGEQRPEMVHSEEFRKDDITVKVATTGQDGTSKTSTIKMPMTEVRTHRRLR